MVEDLSLLVFEVFLVVLLVFRLHLVFLFLPFLLLFLALSRAVVRIVDVVVVPEHRVLAPEVLVIR